MPDLVPDDRIEKPPAPLGDLEPGEQVVIDRATLSVTKDKVLVVFKNRIWADNPKPSHEVTLFREADGTWCADLSKLEQGYQFKPVPMEDLFDKRMPIESQYIIIEKIQW